MTTTAIAARHSILRTPRAPVLAACTFAALGTLGSAGELVTEGGCVFAGPSVLDPGLPAVFTLDCAQSFDNVIQLGVDPTFVPGFLFPATSGLPASGGYRSTLTVMVPWDPVPGPVFLRTFWRENGGALSVTDPLSAAFAQGDRVYESTSADGLFVIEMEWERPVEDWDLEMFQPGYAGNGYLVWNGSNFYNDPCQRGTLDFRFQVEVPGTYALAIRSYHEGGDLNNDVWARYDDGECKKVFCSTSGSWAWNTLVDPGNGGFKEFLTAGEHTLSFSARSQLFLMDRIHLFNLDRMSRSEIEDAALEPSTFFYE
jgi:hypothetical protein